MILDVKICRQITVDDLLLLCYIYSMTIEQTVEIPADYRLLLELPHSVPSGVKANVKIDIPAKNSLGTKEQLSKQFAGALRLSDTAYKTLQNSLQEGRNEWNRNIF
jgi:hypothetical protein